MNLKKLVSVIKQTSISLQKRTLQSVNQLLVIRNWLIGCYIVEYEQKGSDRAKYGDKLIQTLADELKNKKIKGMSVTNFKLFRQFFLIYPQIGQALPDQFNSPIFQSLPDKFKPKIGQVFTDHLNKQYIPAETLIKHLSFTHFTELIKIDDPLKRAFYEKEIIKGNWSSRQLKRQIETLLIERISLSKNKKKMLNEIQKKSEICKIENTIKDPYVLEFTGFREFPKFSENELETALLNKIQDFLVELGHGFCFEARQKRITIGNEHDRIDLVFYHRILKCHVLIDLKIRAFSNADVGQMNFYLNYYKKNVMSKGDKKPVGIILCTDKENVKVEYATSGISNQMFVSKYMTELPNIEELQKLLYLE